MKILIVGSNSNWAIENYYARHLQILGLDIFRFNSNSIFLDYYEENLVNKLKFRLGLSAIYKTINQSLIEICEQIHPDVLFVFKGMEVFPETVKLLKKTGIVFVGFNPDNPFIFSGRGSGNSNVTDSIRLYDLHFTYNEEVKCRIEKEFKIRTELLHFAFEENIQLDFNIENQDELLKCCFIGNADVHRIKFLNELSKNGIEIEIYGNGWSSLSERKGITLHSSIFGNGLWPLLRKYRIQLNLMRIHNLNSHNMRSFEIPGVGGVQLAPDTYDHRTIFRDNENIFLFDSIKKCTEKIEFLLNQSKSDIDKVRNEARSLVLAKHKYSDRANQILKILETL